MKVLITNHAKEQFKIRWKSEGNIENVVNLVLKEGKLLSKSLLKTTFLLGYHLEGYWTSFYKVYQNFLFVFKRDKDLNYTLVTLMPLHFLKTRQLEMLGKIKRRKYELM